MALLFGWESLGLSQQLLFERSLFLWLQLSFSGLKYTPASPFHIWLVEQLPLGRFWLLA
jgi:hypothetical protein